MSVEPASSMLPSVRTSATEHGFMQFRHAVRQPATCSRSSSTPMRAASLHADVCRGSWKRMFLESPHLRFEGLYVSRNTYIRQGVSEWKREKTCHLVTYFRYFR